ncbi:TPA: sugar ABC transporter substrate-binding protein [Enterococcus faecium]
MKHFKKIALTGIAVLTGTLLAACGGGDSKSKDGQVTLSYASWDTDQAPGLRKMLDEFEKQNPDIKVEMETTPWDQYWVKLEAATTGGNMPDVVTMHSSESYKYMSQNALMGLDDVIKENDIDMGNFTEGIADFYTLEDELYAIPKDASVVGLWYNKELFDNAGVDYPDETWTWETLRQAAIDLTDESKGIYGFASHIGTETGYWPFIYQNGGEVFADDNTKSGLNTPEAQEVLAFYRDIALVDHASPTITELQDPDKLSRFQSGRLAMMIEGNWFAPGFLKNDYLVENVASAVLPKGKVNATITNGLGWAASANTKYPEEVKKLMAFLASEDANKIQAETGASIPALKGFEDEWAASSDTIDLSAFGKMLEYGVPRPYNKDGLRAEQAEVQIINRILSGEVTVEDGTTQIEKEVNAILSGN